VKELISITTTSSLATPNGPSSPFPSRTAAAAYDDLLAEVLPQAREQRVWNPSDGPLYSIFVSHGAPFTLDDPQWLSDFFDWAQSMPEPRAIVVVSAHWEEEGILVLGSGFMTHSIAVFRRPELAADTTAFDEWAVDALTDYHNKAPGAAVAHPTADHFVPLLLTVGAADDPGNAVSAIGRMVMGNSTRSVQLT
jgi:4,5-DOPA dioxygenase extradiol